MHELCPSKDRGRRESRVSDAPAASCAKCRKHTSSHHRFTGFIRHSLHNGFNGFLRALPGDRALLPPSSRERIPRNLTPASGRQDHTTSPSATSAVRLRAGRPLTSPIRTRPATPFARRRCRVHRIPPRVRDDREPPLWGRDGRAYRVDFSSGESGIFFESGLDTDLPTGRLICPTGQFKRQRRMHSTRPAAPFKHSGWLESLSLSAPRPAPGLQRTAATRTWRPGRPAADPAGSPTAPCAGGSPCS